MRMSEALVFLTCYQHSPTGGANLAPPQWSSFNAFIVTPTVSPTRTVDGRTNRNRRNRCLALYVVALWPQADSFNIFQQSVKWLWFSVAYHRLKARYTRLSLWDLEYSKYLKYISSMITCLWGHSSGLNSKDYATCLA